MEQIGGECLDVALRYPRCAEIGVDVAGQHVLGLHGPQGLDIAGIGRAGTLRRRRAWPARCRRDRRRRSARFLDSGSGKIRSPSSAMTCSSGLP